MKTSVPDFSFVYQAIRYSMHVQLNDFNSYTALHGQTVLKTISPHNTIFMIWLRKFSNKVSSETIIVDHQVTLTANHLEAESYKNRLTGNTSVFVV